MKVCMCGTDDVACSNLINFLLVFVILSAAVVIAYL